MANEMWLVSAKDVDFYAAQNFSFDIYKAVNMALRYVPRADARPVVHGKWLYSQIENPAFRVCDQCGSAFKIESLEGEYNYCPSCGSQMDGGGGDANKN